MENGPFEDVFPIEHGGFSMAMLVYQGVPGDSKWPCHPPVGGRVTIQKGHKKPSQKGHQQNCQVLNSLLVWGPVVWDSYPGTPKNPNPFHFRESFPEPNHQAPKPPMYHFIDGYPLVN